MAREFRAINSRVAGQVAVKKHDILALLTLFPNFFLLSNYFKGPAAQRIEYFKYILIKNLQVWCLCIKINFHLNTGWFKIFLVTYDKWIRTTAACI